MSSKPKRIRLLIKRARRGDLAAMYDLGIQYELGKYIPCDMQKAAFWINLAAQSAYVKAVEWISDYSFDDNARIQAES